MDRNNYIGLVKVFNSLPFTNHALRSLVLITVFMLLFATCVMAADKLVIKNATGSSDVFKVGDNGVLDVSGTDSLNNFKLNFAGHAGGSSHLQISTGLNNSRLTLMAGSNTEYAPRFIAIGSEDDSVNKGCAYFDYGSYIHSLPNATFNIRYLYTSGTQPMLQFFGQDKVIFPIAKVGIGTTNPQGALDVNGAIYQRGGVLHADYVFEPTYKIESIDDHARYMWENKHLKAIPGAKTDENGQEIVEVGSHQRGILEELEKAHIYIEQLSKKIKDLETKISNLEKSRQ